jgi:hypothetical protein
MRFRHEALCFSSAEVLRANGWHFVRVLACRLQLPGREMPIDRDASGVLNNWIKMAKKTDENRLL